MTNMDENSSENGLPRVEERLRVGPIIRDVVIIWALTFMGGFVAGVALGGLPGQAQRLAVAVGVSTWLFGTVGFTIAGCLAPPDRWRHIGFVALGVWIMSPLQIAFTLIFDQ